MKIILTIVIICLSIFSYGQWSEQKIDTDSSEISIVRNSVYRVYKEIYKYKDSIWYSVSYIDDTTQINTEGWLRKPWKYTGIWKEYAKNGEWMYTKDYDKGTYEVNPELYPYSDLLEKMKLKADSLVINTYSKDFYDKYVRFEFESYAYYAHWITIGDETFITKDYLGSLTEPLKGKPNSYKFRYEVRLAPNDKKSIEIGIDLDSLGNYEPSKDDFWNNYGFEEVIGDKKTFLLDTLVAKQIAIKNGLKVCDTCIISEFLTWENYKNRTFYNGKFCYYIIEQTSKTEYKEGKDRQGIIYRFNVYSFNPWTGEFIEKKKMKSRSEWGPNSGHSTGLLPDND